MQPPVTVQLLPDNSFPNNSRLPLVLYEGLAAEPSAVQFERLFEGNSWAGSWRDGVYDFHHYHSCAHEVLGVYAGRASVQFGGPNGPEVNVSAGDVVVIPAGVAHRRVSADAAFRVVGAYPDGQHPDMCYGKPEERPEADSRIAAVALPLSDPAAGAGGPLLDLWR